MLVKCSVEKIELTVDVFTNTICCVDCKPFLEINVLSICFIFMQRRMTSLLPRRGHPYPSPSQQRIPCEASRPPRWGGLKIMSPSLPPPDILMRCKPNKPDSDT